MNHKKMLKGSPKRDAFKRMHKELPGFMYALDIDFALITKKPIPNILAIQDAKGVNDCISFTEVIAYNHFLALSIPVYIVQEINHSPVKTCECCGSKETDFSFPWKIQKYLSGDPYPNPPIVTLKDLQIVNSMNEYESWERGMRDHLIESITERGHWLSQYEGYKQKSFKLRG